MIRVAFSFLSLILALAATTPAWSSGLVALERESRDNLEKLLANRGHIQGIEIVLAEGSSDHVYSRWGHVLLRFVEDNEPWNKQPVLSFVADVDVNQIDAFKGLNGSYPVLPSLMSFEETWNHYVQGEGRSLDRYVIPATPEQVTRLLQTIRKWSEDPTELGGYRFFSRNCSTVMFDLLKDSGFEYVNDEPVIPTHFAKWLVRSWLSPLPPITVHDPFGLYDRAAKLLSITRAEFLSGKNWPSDSAARILVGLDEKEIKQLYRSVTAMPFDVSLQIAAKVNYFKGAVDYDQVMEMKALPPVLYTICSDDACFEKLSQAERSVWSENALQAEAKKLAFWMRNSDLGLEGQRPVFDTGRPFNLVIFPDRAEEARQQEYVTRIIDLAGLSPPPRVH